MIRSLFGHFRKNFVYVFIPMGIVYLFLLVGAIAFVSSLSSALSSAVKAAGELIHGSVTESSANVNEFLAYSLDRVDWHAGFFAVIRQIAEQNWIAETVRGFFATLDANTEGFEEQFGAIVRDFAGSVRADFRLTISFLAVGVLLATLATGFAVRRRSAVRDVRRLVRAYTVVPVFQTLVIVGFSFLAAAIRAYSLIVVLAAPALVGTLTLMSSWLVYRDGTLRLRDVLTLKNVALCIASFAIAVLSVVAVVLLCSLLNALVAALLAVPLVIFALSVADVNADSFVRSLFSSALSGEKGQAALNEPAKPVGPVEPASSGEKGEAAPNEPAKPEGPVGPEGRKTGERGRKTGSKSNKKASNGGKRPSEIKNKKERKTK